MKNASSSPCLKARRGFRRSFSMKSVDSGILSKSECFSFQPSELAAKTMKYLTWCGHYFCTNSYFMERDTYPYVLVSFVREGNMNVRYREKNYLIKERRKTPSFRAGDISRKKNLPPVKFFCKVYAEVEQG